MKAKVPVDANFSYFIEASSDAPELLVDLKQQYQDVSKELVFATEDREQKEMEEYDAETVLNHCTYFMANAYELWERAPVEERFRFQGLIFPDGISFSDLDGKRTPKMSLIYQAVRDLQMPKNPMAE